MTLKEIAGMANVSTATVSYVLNGRGGVSEAVAERIRAIAEQHGYTIPQRGRRVRAGVSGTARGSVVYLAALSGGERGPDSAWAMPLSRALQFDGERALREAGYALFVAEHAQGDPIPDSLQGHSAHGVIALNFWWDPEWLRPRPVVWALPMAARAFGDTVHFDEEQMARAAVEYFRFRDCRQMALFSRLPDHPAHRRRVVTFLEYAKERDIQVASLFPEPSENVEFIVRRMEELTMRPAGVFLAVSNRLGSQICQELVRRQGDPALQGIEVLPAFSNPAEYVSEEYQGPYFDLALDAIGHAAVDLLLWRMEHKTAPRRVVLVEPRLVPSRDAARSLPSS